MLSLQGSHDPGSSGMDAPGTATIAFVSIDHSDVALMRHARGASDLHAQVDFQTFYC